MILNQHGIAGLSKSKGVVHIGTKDYPWVKIGNLLWTTTDFDESVGTVDYQSSFGKLYIWDSVVNSDGSLKPAFGSIIPDGWRIPSSTDFLSLFDFIKRVYSDLTQENWSKYVKSKTDWLPYAGVESLDTFGFNMKPSGSSIFGGDRGIGEFSFIGTSTINGSKVLRINADYRNDTIWLGSFDYTYFSYSLRLVKDASSYVTIGGRQYKTVTIGNQEWLAENLDYKFLVNGSQIPIGESGAPSTPSAWYYNNDEATYGVNGNKYGLLYNWHATKYLEDNKSTLLPYGWHVPTTSEWDALATAVGGSGVAGTKLKSTTGWSSGNGDGSYGFAAFPAGFRDSGFFDYLGSYTSFWAATESSSSLAYYRYFNTGASVGSSYDDKSIGCSVRLVKDAT